MSLFKKRLDLITYWKKKTEYLFSDEWVKFAQVWKEQCPVQLEETSFQHFLTHFRAASLQIIGIVISRTNATRDRRIELGLQKDSYIRNLTPKDADTILSLYKAYNSSFGSSFTDGVRPMAQLFASSMGVADTTPIEEFFYETFYTMIGNMLTELKRYKLQ